MSNPSYSIRFPSNSDSQMALSSKYKRRREEINSCAPYKWEFLLFPFFVIRDLYFGCFVVPVLPDGVVWHQIGVIS